MRAEFDGSTLRIDGKSINLNQIVSTEVVPRTTKYFSIWLASFAFIGGCSVGLVGQKTNPDFDPLLFGLIWGLVASVVYAAIQPRGWIMRITTSGGGVLDVAMASDRKVLQDLEQKIHDARKSA